MITKEDLKIILQAVDAMQTPGWGIYETLYNQSCERCEQLMDLERADHRNVCIHCQEELKEENEGQY